MKRKLCVVTGTRADYGLLSGLMSEILADQELELQIIATGTHLSPEYGMTASEIERDGFQIDVKVEMLLSADTSSAVAKSVGLAVIGFADAYERLKPDLIVVLGDRFEILAAAQAAMLFRIPVAHISGGEITQGAVDDMIRHAVTKMSHLHFVAAETYRRRVLQLGEQGEFVFNVGEPALDNIRRLTLMARDQLEADIGYRFHDPQFLVTYHPVTLGRMSSAEAMRSLLEALDRFPQAGILFTMPNADMDSRVIIQMIREYEAARPTKVKAVSSLGLLRYLSAMRLANVVIGNSSSGITEAPALRKATVNIGDRQAGRLHASSIINCGEHADEIAQAIENAISASFQQSLPYTVSLYGEGDAALRMKELLKHADLDALRTKKFNDWQDVQ
ncbi:UDP-N-acetylglucosamine 2-epimerase [Cohnella hashimotonis]|uniref:UDP-N-acetylglucosamine 2-epimerase n=1 Tax=Cohnella hashimotonis TaxID=2826895 RepID=A0ABT6TU29_9BACL|nr:UDP-N-acetylglucosamine 2-epimerase [Cohnella hashimotonis]MDI4650366.1 UDP-N-acetylglucosamine 2-epimerase [Cohnella hashimotonis]